MLRGVVIRILSLVAFFALWELGSLTLGPRLLPGPGPVLEAMVTQMRSGALPASMAATLARVAASFALAMSFGLAIGYAMGRSALSTRRQTRGWCFF